MATSILSMTRLKPLNSGVPGRKLLNEIGTLMPSVPLIPNWSVSVPSVMVTWDGLLSLMVALLAPTVMLTRSLGVPSSKAKLMLESVTLGSVILSGPRVITRAAGGGSVAILTPPPCPFPEVGVEAVCGNLSGNRLNPVGMNGLVKRNPFGCEVVLELLAVVLGYSKPTLPVRLAINSPSI